MLVDVRYDGAKGDAVGLFNQLFDLLCECGVGAFVKACGREIGSGDHCPPLDESVVGAGVADINAENFHLKRS